MTLLVYTKLLANKTDIVHTIPVFSVCSGVFIIMIFGCTPFMSPLRTLLTQLEYSQISCMGLPGVLGSWGEGLFIFRELGSTANYFRGAGEQAHTFGD